MKTSADYRQHIVSGLFKDTLESAWIGQNSL